MLRRGFSAALFLITYHASICPGSSNEARHCQRAREKGEEKETIGGSAFERNAATLATLGEH